MSKLKFVTILFETSQSLGLNPTESMLMAIIKYYSSDNSDIPGWCYASKQYLADHLQVSLRTTKNAISKLESKGLLEKNFGGRYLRTTKEYNRFAYQNNVAPTVQNLHSTQNKTVQNLHEDGANIARDGVQILPPIIRVKKEENIYLDKNGGLDLKKLFSEQYQESLIKDFRLFNKNASIKEAKDEIKFYTEQWKLGKEEKEERSESHKQQISLKGLRAQLRKYLRSVWKNKSDKNFKKSDDPYLNQKLSSIKKFKG